MKRLGLRSSRPRRLGAEEGVFPRLLREFVEFGKVSSRFRSVLRHPEAPPGDRVVVEPSALVKQGVCPTCLGF